MTALLLIWVGAWVPFSIAGPAEAWWDDASHYVVTVDTSGVPVRVGPVADLSSAVALYGGGVAPSSGSRYIGYSLALLSVVGPEHYGRSQVEAAQLLVAWLSCSAVVFLVLNGLVFGYWISRGQK